MSAAEDRNRDPRATLSTTARGTPRFDDRVALITGAGSGIGREFARGFASEGGRVALFGRTIAKLAALADALLDAGVARDRVVVAAGHHESCADVDRALAAVDARWSRLDVLFNNAGTYHSASVAETDDATWDDALRTNLTGPFVASRQALPLLRASRGIIINNASTLGLRPVPGCAAYAVAKAGLVQLTRATALEEAAHGVRVVAICPGVVDTPIHAARTPGDPEAQRRFLRSAAALHPLGRVGTAEEVAALALFLASDASSWITGSVMTIDGGISL